MPNFPATIRVAEPRQSEGTSRRANADDNGPGETRPFRTVRKAAQVVGLSRNGFGLNDESGSSAFAVHRTNLARDIVTGRSGNESGASLHAWSLESLYAPVALIRPGVPARVRVRVAYLLLEPKTLVHLPRLCVSPAQMA